MHLFLFFIMGLALLIKGADIFVDGAASLAWRLGVSRLVIGLTVVSMGTSAPELVVNLIAAFQGSSDIAVGNILGSNIANILLILGISAFLFPVNISRGTAWKETPYSLFALIMLFFMTHDYRINPSGTAHLNRKDGMILLTFFALFIYYVLTMAGNKKREETAHIQPMGGLLSLVYIILGLGALTLGGRWFVNASVETARALGLSEAVIGLTIVAIGTSLPELAVSVSAACKKHSDIVIGNVIGSNIFNILWVLGITAVIHPLPWNSKINVDLLICCGATVLLFGFCFTGRKYCLERWEGSLFFLAYCAYLAFLILIR